MNYARLVLLVMVVNFSIPGYTASRNESCSTQQHACEIEQYAASFVEKLEKAPNVDSKVTTEAKAFAQKAADFNQQTAVANFYARDSLASVAELSKAFYRLDNFLEFSQLSNYQRWEVYGSLKESLENLQSYFNALMKKPVYFCEDPSRDYKTGYNWLR